MREEGGEKQKRVSKEMGWRKRGKGMKKEQDKMKEREKQMKERGVYTCTITWNLLISFNTLVVLF